MIVEKKEVLRKMVNRMSFFDKEIKYMMKSSDDYLDEYDDYVEDISNKEDILNRKDNFNIDDDNGVIIAKGEKVASVIEDILNTFRTKEQLCKALCELLVTTSDKDLEEGFNCVKDEYDKQRYEFMKERVKRRINTRQKSS